MSEKKSIKSRKTKSNTGVRYITLISNEGFRVEFQPDETGEEKVKAINYSFGFCKGVRPAFERSVKCRYDFEMEKFGKTNIDLAKMDDYWKLVQENYPPEKLKWL